MLLLLKTTRTAIPTDNNYEVEVLADNPVFLGPWEETSGNIVDMVNDLQGVPSGSPSYNQAGLFGKGMVAFPTTSDFFTYAYHTVLKLGNGPFTLEAIVTRPTDSGTTETLFHTGTGGYGFGISSTDRLILYKSGVGVLFQSNTTVPTGASFIHIAVTRSGSGAGNTKLYINGVDVTDTAIDANAVLLDTTAGLEVGREGAAQRWMGKAGYVAIYKSVLSEARIDAHVAAMVQVVSGSLTADSILHKNVAATITGDAVLKATIPASFTADAVLAITTSGSWTADAILFKTIPATFTGDAILLKTAAASFTADAVIETVAIGYVKDDFNRTESSGAGTTSDGLDAWTANFAPDISVNGSKVVFNVPNNGSVLNIKLANWRRVDSESTVEVNTSADITGSGAKWYELGARYNIYTNDYYLGRFTIDANGDCVVNVWKFVSAVKTQLGASVNLGGLHSGSGDVFKLKLQVEGTYIRFKAWRINVHTPEPGWQVERTDSDVTIKGTGILHAQSSVSNAATLQADNYFGTPIPTIVSDDFTADAVLRKEVAGSFTADAFLLAVVSSSFTANAVLLSTIGLTATADAILRRTEAVSFTADAILHRVEAATFTADAILRRIEPFSFTADAYLLAAGFGNFTADAILKRTENATFTADAILRKEEAGSFTADSILRRVEPFSFTTDGIIRRVEESSFTADAVLKAAGAGSFTADAVIVGADERLGSFTADSIIKAEYSATFDGNAVLRRSESVLINADAVLRRVESVSITADSVLRTIVLNQLSADAVLQKTLTDSFTADAALIIANTGSFTADAVLVGGNVGSFTADAVLHKVQTSSFTAAAWLAQPFTNIPTVVTALVEKTIAVTTTAEETMTAAAQVEVVIQTSDGGGTEIVVSAMVEPTIASRRPPHWSKHDRQIRNEFSRSTEGGVQDPEDGHPALCPDRSDYRHAENSETGQDRREQNLWNLWNRQGCRWEVLSDLGTIARRHLLLAMDGREWRNLRRSRTRGLGQRKRA